jgi:hypothetical protein
MGKVQFNAIVQHPTGEIPFSFKIEDLKYDSEAGGTIKCSGPWNPPYCFPRGLICFQGHSFSVGTLYPGDDCAGSAQLVFIPSSMSAS